MSRPIRDLDHLRQVLEIPFSDEQAAAISAPPDAPQAIIAGAGSGKTAVMAARVVWLVGHAGVDPGQVLGLTFTAKAAAELGERVRASLRRVAVLDDDAEPTVSTYHAFAGVLLREHGLRLGYEPDAEVVADARRFELAARVIRRFDGPLLQVSTHLPTVVERVIQLDGQMADHLVDPDELLAWNQRLWDQITEMPVVRGGLTASLQNSVTTACAERAELTHLVLAYRVAKLEAGLMDFSDQMAAGARLAQLPEVATALREQFRIVLLDEYQDTSVAQRDLLKALFSGPDPARGRGHGVTAVGDPAQGIYGWRGAAAGNLAEFLDDFPTADGGRGVLHSLAVSRRCAQAVIDLANHVAAPYYDTTEVVQPLEAAPGAHPGLVEVALHETVADEIEAVVEAAMTARAAGDPLTPDQPLPWSSIAILVRTVGENQTLVEALRARQIPVEVLGLSGLLHRPEVLDVLAVLELLEDVTANASALRLLTGPRGRIGPRDLALLGARAHHLARAWQAPSARDAEPSLDDLVAAALAEATAGTDTTEVVALAEAVEDPGPGEYSPEARERLADLASLLAGLRRHLGEPLADVVRRVITALDLDIELRVTGQTHALDNLALLGEVVADYASHDRYASLTGLIAHLRAAERFERGLEPAPVVAPDAVSIMTVHKSKGLEFDTVIVPMLSKDVFPSGKARSLWHTSAQEVPTALRGDRATLPADPAWTTKGVDAFKAASKQVELLEETRLAYVALTRAKRRLVVSGHVWGRTHKQPRGPSPFLLAVREWVTDRGAEPTVWTPVPAKDETTNPLVLAGSSDIAWPAEFTGLEAREVAAARVRAGATGSAASDPAPGLAEARADLDLLLAEAARAEGGTVELTLPDTLSATSLQALARDRDAFLRQLARPMPRRPAPQARLGTRFHAWVEARVGQQPLLDPADLPGAGDHEIASDADLQALQANFESGDYADVTPLQVEAPFSIVIAGHRIVGRIDAVVERADGGIDVVDWKTGARPEADPLQLAVYRLAWAEAHDLDPATVHGVFHHVRHGQTERFTDLPGRADLEVLLRLEG